MTDDSLIRIKTRHSVHYASTVTRESLCGHTTAAEYIPKVVR